MTRTDVENGIRSADILLIAAWFGLVTGLVEGVGFLLLQQLGGVMHVTPQIVWVSALFNLLLFGLVGLAAATAGRVLSRLPILTVAVFLFALLAFVDWLGLLLTDRLHRYALIIIATGLAVQITRWFRAHQTPIVRFWRRSLPWVAATGVLAFVAIQSGGWLQERIAIAQLPAASPGSPNVLIIVADTLRADHLTAYGYGRPTSPNISRMAEEGVLYERAFSTSAYTLPSHASLLTGRYPHEHGVAWNTPKALFDSPYPTLAEALRARGYRTAAFSANLFWFTSAFGFARGFISFEDYFHSLADMGLRTVFGRAFEKLVLPRLGMEDIPARKLASDVNRSIVRWLDRDRDRPFFVFVNYMDVHDPYLPPAEYRARFATTTAPGGVLNTRVGRIAPHLTPEQVQGEIDAYDGAIAYLDDQVGRLLGELQKRGLGDDTLVVFTSDHGEMLGEHGMFLHGNSLYRQVIHVPLILWGPGRVPAGVRVAEPVTNATVPATVMQLSGEEHQTLFPGPALTQAWLSTSPRPEWPAPLAEMDRKPWELQTLPVSHGSMKSLVGPQWQYILHEKFGAELFDWQNDPAQVHNLADKPESRDIVERCQAELSPLFGYARTTGAQPPRL